MLHWLLDEKFLCQHLTMLLKSNDTDQCYTQCGMFFGQRNSLRVSPFQKLESLLAACLKIATINVGISGTALRENPKHIATMLGMEYFKASNG